MKITGSYSGPIVVIHGGASMKNYGDADKTSRDAVVRAVLRSCAVLLAGGACAPDVATAAVEQLEAEPLFNAGLGSTLQIDGSAKLSASLMDGERGRFSGVGLVTHLIHPSRLARALQDREDRVLGPLGAQLVARELGLPLQSPVTAARARQWAEQIEKKAEVTKEGTVGAVVRDANGRFAAATSTGGRSFEYPDRMSDVATVAGNYASQFAAISCTGVGEHIIDDAAAARLEERVRGGSSIVAASEKLLREAEEAGHWYGWIAIDSSSWSICTTTDAIVAGVIAQGNEQIV